MPRKFSGVAVLLFCSVCTAMSYAQPQDYSVQFGSFSTLTSAQKRIDELDTKYPDHDFEVRQIGDAFKVTSPRYDTYAEAWAVKDDDLGDLDSFIVSLPESSLGSQLGPKAPSRIFDITSLGQTSSTIRDTFVSMRQDPAGILLESELAAEPGSMAREQLFRVGMNAPKNAQGIPALERFIANHGTDQKLHQCCLRLARRYMGRGDMDQVRELLDAVSNHGSLSEKQEARHLKAYATLYEEKYEAAFEEFRTIANDTALSDEIRHDAMVRSAASAHSSGQKGKALRAYMQIEEHGATVEVRDEAAIKRLGIMLELARNGKGEYLEVATTAEKLVRSTSGQQKLLAGLMRLEAFMDGEHYEEILREADAFLESSEDFTREYNSALIVKGVALAHSGRYEEAKAVFSEVISADLSSAESFANVNLNALAGAWLLDFSQKYQDHETSARLKKRFDSDWSETKEAQRIINNGILF